MTPDLAPVGQAPAAPTVAPTPPVVPAGVTPPAAPVAPAAVPPVGGKEGAPPAQPKPPAVYTLMKPADNVWLTERDLKRVEVLAREQGLTNEGAQALLDGEIDRIETAWAEELAELTADLIYGGDKLTATQALANTVIDRVRPPGHPRAASFRQFLDRSAAGNNLEVLSFLADLGKLMAEDRPGAAPVPSAEPKTLADRLYPEKAT